MADNEEEKINQSEEPVTTSKVAVVRTSPPWPLITIGVFATVVIASIVIGGWAFIASHRESRATSRFGLMGQSMQRDGEGQLNPGGFRRGGMTQQAVARGVVTAINGDTVTVSGLGKQTTVKKSSTTTISGDKTDIAVNDTIVVYGTTNTDNSVAATRIVVNNQLNGGRAAINDSIDSGDTSVPGV